MGENIISTSIRTQRIRAFIGATALALALTVICPAPATLAADVSIKPGDQVVRIVVPDAAKLAQLEAMDLDIWSHEYGVGPVEVHASIAERQALTAAGFAFDMVQQDLTTAYLAEQSPQPHGPGFNAYMDLPTIVDYINTLAATRPDLCSVSSIGQSIQDRDIWVLKITGPGGGTKPGVFYHGLQHAREWITGPAVLYLANYLVSNYDADPCVRELVNQTEFHLAPCVNPDGYSYTWQSSNTRLWRKNRRQNANGSFGVDLNRNWSFGWGGGGSSGTQSSDTYRGTAPFSEPETAAIRDFIIAHPNIRAHMDYHSYGHLIMWPFGNECATPPEPDATTYSNLGVTMQALIAGVHGVNYNAGPICQTLYQASGASVDYIYGDQNRFGMTIELRPGSGNPGFILPADQIIPTCEENLPAILYLSRWASSGLAIDPLEPIPSTVVPDTDLAIRVGIRNVQQVYVTDSARLHYRLGDAGPFVTAAVQHVAGNEYEGLLPGIPCGASLQFYFTAQGDQGYIARTPCGAPDVVYVLDSTDGNCPPLACGSLPGDMNGDSDLNGLDIEGFARAMTQPPHYAICADLATPFGLLDKDDVSTLIARLLEN